MSPILVRPVREQLEHDRVIQALQGRYRRRFDTAVNFGADQAASVRVGGTTLFPDLVLTASKGVRRLAGVVEVETGESVNHLEAMAQWVDLGRVRAPFYLYVPAGAADVARRLCMAHEVSVAEIWSYHAVGDVLRFTMVHRSTPRRSRATGSAGGAGTAREVGAGRRKAPAKAAGRKTGTGRAVASRAKSAPASRTVRRPAGAAKKTAKKTATKHRAKTVTKKAGASTSKRAAKAKKVKAGSTRISKRK